MKNLISMRLRVALSGKFPKLVMLTVVVILAAPHFASSATFNVNSKSDRADKTRGDGKCDTGNVVVIKGQREVECTLRAAIQESNALPGFPPAQINLPSDTYVLTLGEIEISDSLFLDGAGPNSTIIDGNNRFRIFFISNPGTNPIVNISGVTIQHGEDDRAVDHEDGIGFGRGLGFGIGIFVSRGSSLFLANSVVRENRSAVGGVGISNGGSLTLFRSTVRDNVITGGGGGITGVGGGLENSGNLEIIESTISGNRGIRGGGITNTGSLDITNSTISGNKASRGGGILNFSSGVVNVSFSTITDNEAGLVTGESLQFRVGGGVENLGQVNIGNTILAGNRDRRDRRDPLFSPDCFSVEPFRFTSFRGNLVGIINENCDLRDTIFGAPPRFDMVGTEENPLDPRLELDLTEKPLLRFNGGPTQTHALLSGSPAVDQGTGVTSARFFDCPETDQRGFRRPFGRACDIGAFEFGVRIVNNMVTQAPIAEPLFDPTPVPGGPEGTLTIRPTFTNASPSSINNPIFEVLELSGGNLLLNADGGPDGVGARLTLNVGADGVLLPGESFTANPVIGLQTRAPFTFFVNLLGVPNP